MKVYKEYGRIVYRHLKCKRVQSTMHKLLEYVNATVGKQYGFNLWSIFNTVRAGKEKHFCSELVANAYKAMGLLPEEVSAGSYLPVSFSGDQQLEWKDGATLGQEYMISFDGV